MNTATTTSSPANPIGKRDLDGMIAQAEAHVRASDASLSAHAGDIKRALKARAGMVLIGAAAVGALAAVLVWRPWQSRAERASARLERRERKRWAQPVLGSSSVGAGWALLKLLNFVWPLLPLRVPAQAGPRLAAFLAALGLPPAAQAGAEAEALPPPAVEEEFDPLLYYGRWFEIARLPQKFERSCAGDVTATYLPLRDDSDMLGVMNACRRGDGRYEVVDGVARIVDAGQPAKLQVTFAPALVRALPFVWADYWVLQVDPDYSVALVGTPDRRNLWFLAREPAIDDGVFTQMREYAVAQGYDLSPLIMTAHTPPPDEGAGGASAAPDYEYAH